MSALIYPVHFHRQFERRWAARAADDRDRRSPPQGTDTCTACGDIVTAPSGSTHLPTGKIANYWRCSKCGNAWDTFADSPVRKDAKSLVSRAAKVRHGEIESPFQLGDNV